MAKVEGREDDFFAKTADGQEADSETQLLMKDSLDMLNDTASYVSANFKRPPSTSPLTSPSKKPKLDVTLLQDKSAEFAENFCPPDSETKTGGSTSDTVIPVLSWSSLDIKKRLGRGGCGETSKAILKQNDGSTTTVVVKEFFGDIYVEEAVKEARALLKVDGAGGVPKLYGIIYEPLAIVMSYCTGITFSKFILKNSLEDCLMAYKAAKEALKDFHKTDFAHNDITESNIMIRKKGQNYIAHLIDLGNAVDKTQKPKLYKKKKENDKKYLK
ncbi:hypothetical protein OTU49_017276, partial [Cherax quadricarinatus]